METLKYAILGLLMKKDMTGYELTKEFNSALFEFWNASHSQIYPKLKALTKEGLIEYHIEITGTVLREPFCVNCNGYFCYCVGIYAWFYHWENLLSLNGAFYESGRS